MSIARGGYPKKDIWPWVADRGFRIRDARRSTPRDKPADDQPRSRTRHTGAGRISRLRLRPMSLHEAGMSTGAISLAAQLEGERARAADPGLTLKTVTEAIARGGWPGFLELPATEAMQRVRDYLDEIRRVDLRAVGQARFDPQRVGRLLGSLARNVATPVAASRLAADAGGGDGPLDPTTVAAYLDALERLFVVENQPAWGPPLRSRYRLRKSGKRHFVDPSLAVAAMATDPAGLLRDLGLLGLLFESLVVRDLWIYAQALAVVVATGYGFVREDGVQVIPVGALGP